MLDRRGIKLASGYNATAVFEGSLTSGAANANSFTDVKVRGADNDVNGQWVTVTSGARDGDETLITDFTGSSSLHAVIPDFGGTLADGVTYQRWRREFRPEFVNNCVNQAIHYITGKAYNPEEDVSLHLYANSRRYVVPGEFAAISKLERRQTVISVSIDPCESGWTEQANVTQAFDTQQRQEGGAALRLILAAGLGTAADFASKTITSLDLAQFDTLEFWVLSSVAISANDHTFRLTSGATTLSFNVPAVLADTWTFHRITMTADQARQLTDVTTIAFRQTVDIGAATVWIDDIKGVRDLTAKWDKIDERLWTADKEAGEIVFKPEYGTVPYSLLKISGGDEPVLLNADATVSEIDPTYMIAFTSHLLLMAPKEGESDREARDRRSLAAFWRGEAENRIRGFPPLQNYRQVR